MNLSGSGFDFIFAFAGGVLISFTPCIYPLIPVTVGYIGLNAETSRLKGFSLSLIYVTGIAVTYSLLGLIAALTGQIFGRISAHPITYLIAGLVIIVFGLSMFDLFQINLPDVTRLVAGHKKINYLSTFVLGLFSGLIIGPCLTPALGAILTYLITKKNVLYGMMLLFSFAYGMGLVLIIVGTFSGLIIGLPKSGKWLKLVKKIGASVILITGLYFIYSAIRRM